jgi:glycosyltransferase involved in cell wall biosynthesis/GT2 family glycosyltransferase
MIIHILTNAIDCGDAVSTHCLLLLNRAKELNIQAFLYAEFCHEALASSMTPIEKLLPQAGPDDVLLHQLFNETSLMPFVEQFPGRRILMYHNITPPEFFRSGSQVFESCSRGLRLTRSLPPLYDLALGMSEFSRRDLEQMGYYNTGVFPLLMDLARLANHPADPASLQRPTVTRLLFVGRIAPNKGIQHLLKFTRAYRDLGEAVSLTLVGNDHQHPEHKEELLGLARELELNVGQEVVFSGKIPDAERNACYRAAHAFVCYSEHEGFCAPLIESMAAGVPTFAWNQAACGDTLGKGGGLFSTLDFAANARMVREVLHHPGQRRKLLDHQAKRVKEFAPLSQRTAIQEMLATVANAPLRPAPPRTVSVVINTYNRGWHLDRCLRSLQKQTYEDFEVVVVNGPSTDDTEARLKSWEGKLRVARTASRVLSVSRNEGIAASNGDLIAFIDDDAVAHPNWLAELVPAFQDGEVGGVGGLVYRMNGRDIEFVNGILNTQGTVKWEQPQPGFHWGWEEGYLNTVSGNNCIFRRAALEAIGGFDERIEYYHDEADVVMRIDTAGFRTLHRPRGIVYHEAAGSHNRKSRYDLNWYVILKNTLYVALKNFRGSRRVNLAGRIVRQLLDQRMKPPVTWFLAQEVNVAEFLRIEAGCARGILMGLVRGFSAASRLREFGKPLGEIQRFPKQARGLISVCLLSQNLPEQSPGGIATYTMALAKGLRDRDVTVHVVSRGDSSAPPEMREGIWHHQASEIPMELGSASLKDTPTLTKNLSYANGVRLKVYEIRAAYGLDLVESPSWDAEGLLLAMDRRLPVVVRWHSPLFKVMETQLWPSSHDLELCCELERLLGQYAEAASGSTEGILSSVSARYEVVPETTALIPLGLDIQPPAKPPSLGNGPHPGLTILFVGRLERRKGIHTLLAALPEVLIRVQNLTVDIAGADTSPGSAGPSWAEQWASEHPALRHRVRFHGELLATELAALYQKCDLFVAPSLYESFGLIYLEAMAFGKAVIGTVAGGIPEVVADGETGLLVQPDDPAQLMTAILRLLEDPTLRARLGAAGCARFLKEFSASALAQRTLQFYTDIVHAWSKKNAPVWQSGPMDAFRDNATRIDWPVSSDSLWMVADPGTARTIWYGPYKVLSPGVYRAEFTLMSDGAAGPDTHVATVDVFNMAHGHLEETKLFGRDFGGSAISVTLFFTVPGDATATYEFRVHTAGATTLSVREITVRQWPSQQLQPTAGTPVWSWAHRIEKAAKQVVVS